MGRHPLRLGVEAKVAGAVRWGYNPTAMRTRSHAPVAVRDRGRPAGGHFWHVTVGRTQAGFTIHERRGQARKWLALFADEDEAWDYAERRAEKPWRILERPTEPLAARQRTAPLRCPS